MKRLVLFGIIIFLIIIGGFLVVDKVWLHRVFKITPGSCLILEEKYCKTRKIKYENNKPIGIEYTVNKNSPIFSLITDDYVVAESEDPNKKVIIIGNQIFDKSKGIVESDDYQISFNGDFANTVSSSSSVKKIKKNIIFGYTNKSNETSVVLTPIKMGINEIEGFFIKIDEEKIKL